MADKNKTDKAGSNLNSTRQLLDELDALMQRMLALPVGDLEEARSPGSAGTSVAAAPEESRMAASTAESHPAAAATEYQEPAPASYQYDEANDEEPSDELSPEHEQSLPEHEAQPDGVDSGESAATTAESPASREPHEQEERTSRLRPVSEEVLSALATQPAGLSPDMLGKGSALLSARVQRTPIYLWPLALLNRVFDLLTYLLGPFGAWLRGSGGRTFLAIVGLVFLLAAVGLQLLAWLAWN
jgi:hypothetical protein